jgi:hypothetical protein
MSFKTGGAMALVKKWILAFVNFLGRRAAPAFLRWLVEGSDFPKPDVLYTPLGPVAYASGERSQTLPLPSYTPSDGSPITIWLVSEAMRRSGQSETMQRDLNASLEVLRVDSVNRPLFMMFSSLQMAGLPIDEVFARVMANVLHVGFIAGRMTAAEAEPPEGSEPDVR